MVVEFVIRDWGRKSWLFNLPAAATFAGLGAPSQVQPARAPSQNGWLAELRQRQLVKVERFPRHLLRLRARLKM